MAKVIEEIKAEGLNKFQEFGREFWLVTRQCRNPTSLEYEQLARLACDARCFYTEVVNEFRQLMCEKEELDVVKKRALCAMFALIHVARGIGSNQHSLIQEFASVIDEIVHLALGGISDTSSTLGKLRRELTHWKEQGVFPQGKIDACLHQLTLKENGTMEVVERSQQPLPFESAHQEEMPPEIGLDTSNNIGSHSGSLLQGGNLRITKTIPCLTWQPSTRTQTRKHSSSRTCDRENGELRKNEQKEMHCSSHQQLFRTKSLLNDIFSRRDQLDQSMRTACSGSHSRAKRKKKRLLLREMPKLKRSIEHYEAKIAKLEALLLNGCSCQKHNKGGKQSTCENQGCSSGQGSSSRRKSSSRCKLLAGRSSSCGLGWWCGPGSSCDRGWLSS